MKKYQINIAQNTEFRSIGSVLGLRNLPLRSDRVLLLTDQYCACKFRREIVHIKKILKVKSDLQVLDGKVKTFENYRRIISSMLCNGYTRESAVIAFGGGSICDLAGFVSATYMRGIKLVFFPTTFLNQIDACMGGKNAVDLDEYKNIVGTFYNPDIIYFSTGFLNPGDISRSAGELIKYFFISPEIFPKDIRRFYSAVKKIDEKAVARALMGAVKIKMSVVECDPLDSSGIREILNLGHTPAHAFEYASGKEIPHGEAVLWGLRYIYLLSYRLFRLSGDFSRRAELALGLENNIKSISGINFEEFNRAVQRDKKKKGKKNRFLLFDRNGAIKPVEGIPPRLLKEVLEELKTRRFGE